MESSSQTYGMYVSKIQKILDESPLPGAEKHKGGGQQQLWKVLHSLRSSSSSSSKDDPMALTRQIDDLLLRSSSSSSSSKINNSNPFKATPVPLGSSQLVPRPPQGYMPSIREAEPEPLRPTRYKQESPCCAACGTGGKCPTAAPPRSARSSDDDDDAVNPWVVCRSRIRPIQPLPSTGTGDVGGPPCNGGSSWELSCLATLASELRHLREALATVNQQLSLLTTHQRSSPPPPRPDHTRAQNWDTPVEGAASASRQSSATEALEQLQRRVGGYPRSTPDASSSFQGDHFRAPRESLPDISITSLIRNPYATKRALQKQSFLWELDDLGTHSEPAPQCEDVVRLQGTTDVDFVKGSHFEGLRQLYRDLEATTGKECFAQVDTEQPSVSGSVHLGAASVFQPQGSTVPELEAASAETGLKSD